MRLFARVLVGLVSAAALAGFAVPADADQATAGEACTTASARDVPYAAISGVDPDLLSLDVSPVAGDCMAPVAVWIHGGGWRVGDKSNDQAAREAFYNAHGWVLVSVNYRLSTAAADPPLRYPAHNNDVAAALAWVDTHIAEYGGDPSRVVLVGHSELDTNGLVDVDAVFEFVDAGTRHSLRRGGSQRANPQRGRIDSGPADDAHLRAARQWAAACAAARVRWMRQPPADFSIPVSVAWGTHDRVLPVHQVRAARRALPMARMVPLPGCGHVPMSDDPELVAGVLRDGSRDAA